MPLFTLKTTRLRQLLVSHYDLEELRTLSGDLQVDFDELRGERKSVKARELIANLRRHGRLDDLIAMIEQTRPALDLETIRKAPDSYLPIKRPESWRWPAVSAALVVVILLFIFWPRSDEPESLAEIAYTPLPSAIATLEPSPSPSPPPATPTPAPSPTPEPTSVFITEYLFELEDEWFDEELGYGCCKDVELSEFTFESGILATDNISGFLRLTRAALGSYGEEPAASITLELTNVTSEPIGLDLDERFFKMRDNHGQEAALIAFCCQAQGEFLGPGQKRTIEMIFQGGDDWYIKEGGASLLYFEVRGLRPIVRATWEIGFPAVAA